MLSAEINHDATWNINLQKLSFSAVYEKFWKKLFRQIRAQLNLQKLVVHLYCCAMDNIESSFKIFMLALQPLRAHKLELSVGNV